MKYEITDTVSETSGIGFGFPKKKISYRGLKHKGSRLELKFAKMLRDKGLDTESRRMIGSGAFDGYKGDIYSKLPFAFECKNQEKVKVWEWWEQAEEARKPFKDPVLVISGNYRPVLVVMKVEDWLNLVKKGEDNK